MQGGLEAIAVADICEKALRDGNKIMFCGNGGSAADCQHLAAELVGKLNFDRPALAAISLTVNTSVLTAIGNDYGYEYVFSRQIQALGRRGDVLIAISTSGNSQNILKAIEVAKSQGLVVIGKTGARAGLIKDAPYDLLVSAPFSDTQSIQEWHMMVGHKYCGIIEQRIFG